jgi:hypothetical protein
MLSLVFTLYFIPIRASFLERPLARHSPQPSYTLCASGFSVCRGNKSGWLGTSWPKWLRSSLACPLSIRARRAPDNLVEAPVQDIVRLVVDPNGDQDREQDRQRVRTNGVWNRAG